MADLVPRIQQAYFRNGPEHRSGADVSFLDIVKIFGFQSIKIGRWVTAAEQQLAANLFFDALSDLMLLAAELLQSESLAFRIAAVPGRAACFLVSHGGLLPLRDGQATEVILMTVSC